MKKILLLTIITSACSFSFGQGQIGNSDMEQWETVSSDEEPVNWNSFLTATGSWAWAASNQIEQSADVRPGSAGTKSCRIWSTSSFSIIANGNVTLGQVNMGSTTPSSPDNYNFSKTSDPNHSETLTDTPDSIVFWVKTNAGLNGNARMKSTLHDSYDYRDPEDATAALHVVATAVLNFAPVANWTRMAVAYDYSGPASGNTHILVTFTTNEIPGGGSANDEVFIDDIELIYNTNSVDELNNDGIIASMNNSANSIVISSPSELNGNYEIFNTLGQSVQSGSLENEIQFNQISGVYFIHITMNDKTYNFQLLKN